VTKKVYNPSPVL
jgi:hypothetical protein